MPSRTYTCYRLRDLPRGTTRFRTPEEPLGPANVSKQKVFTELRLFSEKPRVARHRCARLRDLWRAPAPGHARYHQPRRLRRDELDAFATRDRLVVCGGKEAVRRAARHFERRARAAPRFPALEVAELNLDAVEQAFSQDGPRSRSSSSEAVTAAVPYKDREVRIRVTRRGRFVFAGSPEPEIALGVIRKVLAVAEAPLPPDSIGGRRPGAGG